jgi:hypothetical protein
MVVSSGVAWCLYVDEFVDKYCFQDFEISKQHFERILACTAFQVSTRGMSSLSIIFSVESSYTFNSRIVL